MKDKIKIIECPRDAMQGWKNIIDTNLKIEYINKLHSVGFDTLDMGSFVSAKHVPQMADTKFVIDKINKKSKILVIVVNQKGCDEAVNYDKIDYIGYPFSVSEIFQKKNTGKTIDESLLALESIKNKCDQYNKELVVYLSMAFGNPYNELYDTDIVLNWAKKIVDNFGIKTISLSDTIGNSNPENITKLFSNAINELKYTEIGAHFHTIPNDWEIKLNSAYNAGCRRYDGAIGGYGGCPFAADELVGNMPTERLIEFFGDKNLNINKGYLKESIIFSKKIFL